MLNSQVITERAPEIFEQRPFFVIDHSDRYVKKGGGGRTCGDDGQREDQPEQVQDDSICDLGDCLHDWIIQVQKIVHM